MLLYNDGNFMQIREPVNSLNLTAYKLLRSTKRKIARWSSLQYLNTKLSRYLADQKFQRYEK